MSHKATRWRCTVVPPRKSEGADWRIRIKPPTGLVDERGQPVKESRLSSGTADRALAEQKARAREAELNATVATPLGRDPLLAEVLLEHEKKRHGLAPETLVKLRIAREHAGRVLGDVRAVTLEEADVLRLQDALALKVAPSTVNCYLALLSGGWGWVRSRQKGWRLGPWPRVPALEKQETNKRPFTLRELGQVLDWFAARAPGWLPLVHALVDTGARVSELLATTGDDWLPTTGALVLTKTKTKKRRTVYVTRETAQRIGDRATDAPLFVTPSDHAKDIGRAPTRHGLQQALTRCLAGLGWKKGEHDVHSFRRSFVQDAKRAHVVPAVGRRVTGHASEQQYDSYERHAAGDDLAQVTEQIRAYRSSQGSSPSREQSGRRALRGADPATPYESTDRATRKPMFSRARDASPEAAEGSAESPPRVRTTVTVGGRVWDMDVLGAMVEEQARRGRDSRDLVRALVADAEFGRAVVRDMNESHPGEVEPAAEAPAERAKRSS